MLPDFWLFAFFIAVCAAVVLRFAMSRAAVGVVARRDKQTIKPKPTAVRRAPKAEVVVSKPAPQAHSDDEELHDAIPLSGDPREIEELVGQNSKDSADMNVDFTSFGTRQEAKERGLKKKKLGTSTTQGLSRRTFTSKESNQLKQQGFKPAGVKARLDKTVDSDAAGSTKDDPSLHYTGVSVFEPGWKKTIPRVVEDAGRGVVVDDRKQGKLRRLPFYAGDAKTAPEEPKGETPVCTATAHPTVVETVEERLVEPLPDGQESSPAAAVPQGSAGGNSTDDADDEVVANFVDDDEVVADFRAISVNAAAQPLSVAPIDTTRPAHSGPPPPYGASSHAILVGGAPRKPCRWFHSETGCKYGARCKFAHA